MKRTSKGAVRLTVAPQPPTYLTDAAKAEWRRVAPACVELGVLTQTDLRALELLCSALAQEAELVAALSRDGPTVGGVGTTKANPAGRLLCETRAHALRLMSEFGLTPKGRNGLAVAPPPKPANPFAEMRAHTKRS